MGSLVAGREERKQIVEVDATVFGTNEDPENGKDVPAGSYELVTITPPVGKVYKILAIAVGIGNPFGATSGTHYIAGFWNEVLTETALGSITRNYNEWISFNNSNSVAEGYKGVMFSNDIPIVFKYGNQTDATQTRKRGIRMLCEVYDER